MGRSERQAGEKNAFVLADNFSLTSGFDLAGASQAERRRRRAALSPGSSVDGDLAADSSTPRAATLQPRPLRLPRPAQPIDRPRPAVATSRSPSPSRRPAAQAPAELDDGLIFAMGTLGGRGQLAERGHLGVGRAAGSPPDRGLDLASVAAKLAKLEEQRRGERTIERFKHLARVLQKTQCQPSQPLYAALLEHYGGHLGDTNAEIYLTLSALKSLYTLKKSFGPQEGILAAIMPQNMPLYSLVLYALMPAILKHEVAVHLPQDYRERFGRIYQAVAGACVELSAAKSSAVLNPAAADGTSGLDARDFLQLPEVGRIRWDISHGAAPAASQVRLHDIFINRWKDHADVFVVTGSFEAASHVAISCPSETLTIYNSSGINPVVVAPNPTHPDTPHIVGPMDETIRAIAKRLVRARMLHNGQDCGAPDAIFVHRDQCKMLIAAVWAELQERGDADQMRVVRNKNNYQRAAKFVLDSRFDLDSPSHFEHGGKFNVDTCEMSPSIVSHDLNKYARSDYKLKVREFYAPVFNIFSYQEEQELSLYFDHPEYENTRMFVSLFGQLKQTNALKMNHTVLYDETVIDYDNITVDYGGPGMQASGFIRDHQIYPQAINPMVTIAKHQRLRRENKLGYSAVERTNLAHDAFGDVTAAVPEQLRKHLQWSYFWQDGKEHSVIPSRAKNLGPTRASDKENGGLAADSPAYVSPNLRSDAPLGVVFVVEGEKNKEFILAAIQKFLREKRAEHTSAHRGGDCAASYLALAAGLPRHASDRTYIVTTKEAEEALQKAERGWEGVDFLGPNLDPDDLQKLLVVEALAATSRLGTPTRLAKGLQQTFNKRARACRPLLTKLVDFLCVSKGDILLEGMDKQARKSAANISFGHCQSLYMQPEALPVDGKITPLSCSPR